MEDISGWVERRRHPRIERPDISVTIQDPSRGSQDLAVTDLSLGGMGVFFPDRVQRGQSLRFRLQLPDGVSISGTGVIRWAVPHHLGFRSGVQIQTLGWLAHRKLRRLLERDDAPAADWGHTFDTALWAAALVVSAVVIADWLGIELLESSRLLRLFLDGMH